MNQKIYRIGIVGAGYIGRVHASTFHNRADAELVGIADINYEAAEKLAGEISGAAFPSLSGLIEANPDAIVVCTPPSQRLDLFSEACERGISILAEKPLALDAAMGGQIKALWNETDAVVAVGFCHRFVPFVQRVQSFQKEKKYGELCALSQQFIVGAGGKRLKESWMSDPSLSGGGVLMDTMCHSIDLAQFIAGEFAECDLKTRHAWPGRGETSALVQAKTERDVLVQLSGSWEYPASHFDLRITFERAELFYNYTEPFYTVREEGSTEAVQIPVETHNDRFNTQAGAFLDELSGKTTTICKLDEALSVSRVIDRLYGKTLALA